MGCLQGAAQSRIRLLTLFDYLVELTGSNLHHQRIMALFLTKPTCPVSEAVAVHPEPFPEVASMQVG